MCYLLKELWRHFKVTSDRVEAFVPYLGIYQKLVVLVVTNYSSNDL